MATPTHDNVPRGNIMNDTTLGIKPTPANDDCRIGDVGKFGLGGENGPVMSVALFSAFRTDEGCADGTASEMTGSSVPNGTEDGTTIPGDGLDVAGVDVGINVVGDTVGTVDEQFMHWSNTAQS